MPDAAPRAKNLPSKPAATSAHEVLRRPIESLAGVGPTRGRAFRMLSLETLGDLLEYFPRTYRFESSERTVSELTDNLVQRVRGRIIAVDYIPSRPRPRFEATLEDDTGRLSLVWFHGAYLRTRIHPGMDLRVQGKVKLFRGMPQMTQAKWEPIDETTAVISDSSFRSIYPASLRLPSDVIERVIRENLSDVLPLVPEWFDLPLLKRRGLMGRREAYAAIHQPENLRQAVLARRRLIYDELMLMQLGLAIGKRLRDGRLTAPVMQIDKLLDERVRRRFPFQLTTAQQNAVWQIARDLKSGQPMNRLLQGDVGSGKTVVALYAMLVGVANRLQSALLAPTEVLAEQHYLTLTSLLKDSGVNIRLYTGRSKRAARGAAMKELAEGKVHIAIGTQALIQQDVEFANLGLVVVDEQHKLGVEQRAVLKGKGLSPHYLIMTATPIPRTLALSFFADFDVTTLDELPPGRQPIETRWLRTQQAGSAYDFIRAQVTAGRQAFVVVPQVEDNGLDDAKSVTKELDRLAKGPLSGLRVAGMHGQMDADTKQQTMASFRDRTIDVLVATTVIEVGIDIPNATVILIDNADRFGLSQLHQLRGRVGRGEHPSHCLLISDATTETAEARLTAMTQTTDGFEIAEMDLKIRGPGEFFGTRQHGLPEFKLADITSELPLLQAAKEDATEILAADPRLNSPTHRPLREALHRQFGDAIALGQIG